MTPRSDELLEVRNISVSIRRSPRDVYAYITDGHNIPHWAKGLGQTASRDGEEWIVDGVLGKARVRFAPANQFGVADHDVTLPNGVTVHNPIRVVPNGAGATLIFTLLRQPGVTDEELARDAQTVESDLQTLKNLLETH